MNFDQKYWTERYQSGQTGWDAGTITTPIKEYIDQISDRELRILIPGCGMGYEAEYLFAQGFRNVFVLDISEEPLIAFSKRVPGFPVEQLLCGDFFEHDAQYDLVIEQTFFCALAPVMRQQYAFHMGKIIKPAGKLVGLLFDFPLTTEGPPFGGSKDEYLHYFCNGFEIDIMDRAYNSIKPRQGRELFFIAKKNIE
jgi:methyl halide transferase